MIDIGVHVNAPAAAVASEHDHPEGDKSMAGVEEVRAGIALANQKASESVAALQQATLSLEEAQQALANATQGSGQEEIQHAYGMLAEAAQSLNGVQGTINASITSAENYAGRL
ncbi:hypothetical protein FHR84_002524 [Actinopolyspora biskrensis]|nr:hypothetical protein [Actinopolyspora biskrensis]